MTKTPIHQIVSALGELPPSSADTYLAAAFEQVARMVDCVEGCAVISAREGPDETDPLLGYRLMNLWAFGPKTVHRVELTDEFMAHQDRTLTDPFCQKLAREAGRHRVYHDPDPRITPGMEQSLMAWMWTDLGHVDQMKMLHSVSSNIELELGFYRLAGDEPFSKSEEEQLRELNEAVGTWARRAAFLLGFGPSMKPLSPKEQDALVLLLDGDQQKNFADALGVSAARMNEIVQAVHAKMGTTNRAELQRRWMSDLAKVESGVPVRNRARRRGAGPLAPR